VRRIIKNSHYQFDLKHYPDATSLDPLGGDCGIQAGETTTDQKFTIKEVECLAACGMGPVFQVRETYYTHLTNEKVDEIIEELSK
jgi:NADH-quinone oxidoreductase subunit E